MSLTTLARELVEKQAGKASFGPIAEAACPTAYKQIRKLEKQAAQELDIYLSEDERNRLHGLMSDTRDTQTRNCMQRVLELAEELDYLDDLVTQLKLTHPNEYTALVNQRSSVIGDLESARKLLKKLL